MTTTQAVTTHNQHKSPAVTPPTPQGQMSGPRPLEQGSESSPPLHRYLGNSYVQSLASVERAVQQDLAPPPIVHEVLRAPGQPLDPHTRSLMESLFDADFSLVRIHTNARAAESARAIQARAYTLGRDIVFGFGQYQPHTSNGRQLLTHELIHTVQQEGSPDAITASLRVSSPDDASEREAAHIAHGILIGSLSHDCRNGHETPAHKLRRIGGIHHTSSGVIHRDMDPSLKAKADNDLGLPPKGPFEIRGLSVVIRREWLAQYTTDLNVMEIVAPKAMTVIFERLRTEGIFPDLTDAEIARFAATFTLSGPFPANKPYKEFAIPLSMLMILGAPRGEKIQWFIVDEKDAALIIRRELLEGVDKKKLIEIAREARKNLERLTGLRLSDERRRFFEELIVEDIGQQLELIPKEEGKAFVKNYRNPGALFGETEWNRFLKRFREQGPGVTGEAPIPPWVPKQQQVIKEHLKAKRQAGGSSADIPNDVVVWSNEKDGKYYANVWVHFDAEGKEKDHQTIQLQQEEAPDKLMERIEQATQEVYIKKAAKEADTASQKAPQWAQQLQQQLQKKLALLRKTEPGAKDFPDHLSLNVSTREKPSYREFRFEVGSGEKVRLQVWVNISAATGRLERVGGTLPVPLSPETKVDDLVPPVREAAATLRNKTSGSAGDPDALGIPTGVEGIEQGTAIHEAYPAEIVPLDLSPNGITVTGARNKFGMVLDFTAVHAPNSPDHILTLMQTFYFQWQIFDAAEVKGKGKDEPVSWSARAVQLRKATEKPDEFFQTWGPFRPEYDSDTATVMDKRVRIPEEPGDYLVYCRAVPKTKQGAKSRWATSEAFYPVRVLEAQKVGTEEVTKGPREIEHLRTLLASGKDDKGLPLSPEKMQQLQALLKTLEEQEIRTLPQATTQEIPQIEDLLKKAKELEGLLPDYIAKAEGTPGLKPSDLLRKERPDLYGVLQLALGKNNSVTAYRKELESQLTYLQGIRGRIGKFQKHLDPSSPYMYRPEVAFVSKLTGQVYPLVMMLGESPIKYTDETGVDQRTHGVIYSLVDVTSSRTQDVAHGYNDGDRNDPRTHAAAIANAFEKFGEKANYGEGILVVRIPPGPVRQRDDLHPGTNIRRKDFHPGAQITTYKSKEGNLQKALQWIGYIAAIAGAAALLATGFGAPAAAALLGTIAVTGGVIVATANIFDRARRGKLALDAELALDIISIISVVPAFAVARAALRLRYAARGLTLPTARRAASASRIHGAETSGKFLKIYGTFEVGSTVILVPIKLAQDIDRIENDPTLTRAQKDALIKQAELGALQSFLMLAGSAAATAAGNRKAAMRRTAELEEQQRQQMKLLELEGFGEYRSMAERGYFDAQGDLTPKALAEIEAIEPGARAKLLAEKTPAPEPAAETQPRPTEAQRPRPAASTKPPEPPDTGQPPATRQGPQAGEAESPSVPERIRMSRQEQARRAQVWPQDAETIEQGTRPDARAHARAADFTPMFRQWETLGVQGRKAHIEGLINAHLAREGIPPVKVDWGNQRPGDAEFNPSNWTITLSEKAVSPDQISHLDFAKLVDNAVHEGRHAATTFWGMRVALAEHNYNPNTGVPGKILAEAIAANRRRSPSDELSPEALGEAREIYEVVFDQDQRRARLGAVGVLDRNAVLDRMRATVQHAHDAKALYQSKVDEVKRLEAEDKGSAAHAEALRNVADDYQAWMRAHREAVEAHNAYIAVDEETVSWRMGSAVQAPVLERLPLESRLANLRQQYERAVVEQARKRQGGDSKGADEALARSREAKLAMDKTQAELDSLVSKEPRLVGGRIAKHDLPLTNEQIANPPKAPDYVNPTTRGGSAVPPAPSIPKPPAPPAEPAAPAPARPVRPSGETPAPVKPTPPDAPVQPVPPRRTTQSGSLGGQRLGKILERTIEGTKLSGVAPGIDAGGAPSARPPSAVIAKTTPSPKAPTPDSRTVKGASPDRTIDNTPVTGKGVSPNRTIDNTPVTGKGVSPNRTIDNTPASSPPAGAMQPFTPPGQKRILKAEDYKVQNITAGANRWKRILTHKKTNEIGLFKPERGEVPIQERTGIKAGQRYARTAAAAYLAEKAGIATPEAEMVVFTDPKGPDPGLNEVGSFQKWTTEGDSASKYFNSLSESDYETRINKSQPKLDLDAFDWVIANMDRHPGNWRVVLNPQTGKVQKVIAIDMDVSLPPGPQRYSGSGRWPHLQEALPPTISRGLYGKLVDIEKNWATHAKDLAEFIEPAAIQGAHTRLREVLQKVHAGTIKVVP